VSDGVTGLHFQPGDVKDFCEKAQWAWEHPEQMGNMGQRARQEFEKKYTAERNLAMLEEIYESVVARRDARATAEPETLEVLN
jgi:glycosyltransferase involved in cell wall biosynthesis